jgi:hypothetical protein
MFKKLFFASATLGLVACAVKTVSTSQAEIELTHVRAPAAVPNATLWNKYCIGKADSTDIPQVNYKNEDVKAAAAILNKIAPRSFVNYSGTVKVYKLNKNDSPNPPAGAPAGTTNATHNFLTILCGEFRDRATMIEAKLKWVQKINKLAITEANKPIDITKNIWSQITAAMYQPYLTISEQVFQLKRQDDESKGNRYLTYNNSAVAEKIDYPVPGQTICETKFIFAELIQKGVTSVTDYADYKTKYDAFSAKCSDDDKNYVHVFRGDSNFKPNSPESNGMLFHANAIAPHCETTTKAVKNPKFNVKTTDADCAAYFMSPFMSRWNAARSGLATWMLRDTKHDAAFSDYQNTQMYMIWRPQNQPTPYNFKFSDSPTESISEFLPGWNWKLSDLGLNAIAAKQPNPQDFIYNRIRDGVNRHTEWFKSGFYNETAIEQKYVINGEQRVSDPVYRVDTYTPFVASSYVMTASDLFTNPEYTIGIPGDGFKHWMFIFKVRKENWYNSKSVKDGVPVNFDKMWMDETSFGFSRLADQERAWDRLGTPLEEEFEAILYLHNITTEGQLTGDGITQ